MINVTFVLLLVSDSSDASASVMSVTLSQSANAPLVCGQEARARVPRRGGILLAERPCTRRRPPVTSEPPTTRLLLQRWHQGDRAALDDLLSRNLDWIRSRVHERLGSQLRARGTTGDYVQDVACEILTYIPNFVVEDGERFRGLVARIVENVLRDKSDWYLAKRRSMARERPLPKDTVLHLDLPRAKVVTPTTEAHRREQEAWVRLALELLDETDRLVLVSRDWEGLTFTAIGEKLGLSVDAAERRYKRAFERLALKVKAIRRGDIDGAVEAPRDDGRGP